VEGCNIRTYFIHTTRTVALVFCDLIT